MAAPLTRLPDWQPRLHLWLLDIGRRELVPGQWDCCLFGAGAIEAQTGVDLAMHWRGKYRSFAGGLRLMRAAGYADHVDLIARHLREGQPVTALPGDIVTVRGPSVMPAVGVVQGSTVYVLSERGRPAFVPMTAIQRLFKVG